MANCRPAGLSDEDSDSDGFYDKLDRKQSFIKNYENAQQKTETKLQDAIVNGDLKAAAKVINEDMNDDVNTRLESGWTPLSHACFHAQENIVQFLLDKGADPNLHADSVTPIMLACSNSRSNESTTYNIVSSLIQKDCILNFGDKYGVTPLMRAVINGHVSVVELIIDKDVNIEARDQHGWTAVFWAIHHNQPKCLELLLSKGARWKIVDKSNRSPTGIAMAHEYDEITDILKQYGTTSSENDETGAPKQTDDLKNLTQWQDYYPGLWDESRPKYVNEIHHLLYGMNCDRLSEIFANIPIDLRTFLLLENEDMLKLGIEMPFERRRLKLGLRSFHKRAWKVNAVAGLQVDSAARRSIVANLKMLAAHLQQLYVLEATLTYALRDYTRIQDQIKFEPPDSPTMERLLDAADKMIENIDSVRRNVHATKTIHTKISKDSLRPADLITETSARAVALGVFSRVVAVASLGYVAYRAAHLILNK